MTRVLHCFGLCVLLTSVGCASIARRNLGETQTFPGMRTHAELIASIGGEDPGLSRWWLLDLPFSLVFDILAFPYDLAK
jgi:uncharacterized protein YceK